jgi:5-methylthioadenosine/S-adenosylhomocysteine deaminase
MEKISRRALIKNTVATGAVSIFCRASFAQMGRSAGFTASLPERGEFVIRNAYVMTMDADLGDIPGGDVHVRNGQIIAVGKGLNVPNAVPLSGHGMIVLPGLVETHWHMWTTLARGFSGDNPAEAYFPMVLALTKVLTPEDVFQGTRLGAAEALASGITTVHNWAHSLRGPEYADAELRALKAVGVRGRFSYGWYQGIPDTERVNLPDIERLHKNWASYSNDGLLHLGFGWRGMWRATKLSPDVYRTEFEFARRMGIPISVHLDSTVGHDDEIEMHFKEHFLDKGVLVAHATHATPAEIQILAESGASVSFSPVTDARIGYGFAPASEIMAAGIPCGLSLDTTACTGTCNLFENMKMLVNLENGKAHSEFKLTPRRALELGTIGGARLLGIDDQVGSLKPGKRADLIMVSTHALNMGVFSDPAHMLVEAAEEANIDTVVLDGRILKRHGKMTALNTEIVIDEAAAAFGSLCRRANYRQGV